MEILKSDPLLSPAAVASILGLTPQRLAVWRTQHAGPSWIKYGKNRSDPVRYRASDVLAFIDARRIQTRRMPYTRRGGPTKRARKLAEALCPFPAPLGRKNP